jgi:hypothetical protein
MTKLFLPGLLGLIFAANHSIAQKVKSTDVPRVVQSALSQKYPNATNVTWEKEKGNYEANWGGKSKEDNSVVFTPEGNFVEMVEAIPVTGLPGAIPLYVKKNYNGAKITEAGKVTDAKGKTMYEAEVKGKDLIFDEAGNFLKKD